MSHDLRQALGYRRISSGDPKEDELRDQWYRAKASLAADGHSDTGAPWAHFLHVDRLLADYVWSKALARVEEDRKRHPKAKRNLPAGSSVNAREKTAPGGRALP